MGWLNYTGRIADSPDYYAENADDYPDAPDYDERDAVFAQIASEDGWVVATPENVRAAVQSHMAEHGGEAPGKENGMDKAAEIAAWKENHVPIDRNGDDALVKRPLSFSTRTSVPIAPPEETNARRDVQMEHDRDVTPDVDDTTVSVTSSLYDVQTLLNDDSDAHEDGHAVLREAVQVTSHGRVVSNAVHERPVTIHGESARARAAAAVLAANMDAEEEAEDKEEKSRNR